MEHKILSEYDRVHVENVFPIHRTHRADSDPDKDIELPRFWLPRRALALAALVLVLTTLAAVLWPETLNTILHRNRDISQIGVPIGVPENSAAAITPNDNASTPVSATAKDNTANTAPAAADTGQPNPSSTEIAGNNQRSESEPSVQEGANSRAAVADSALEQAAPTQNTNAAAENSRGDVAAESGTTEMKTAQRPIAPAIKRHSIAMSRRARVVRAQPYEYDDGVPPLYPGSVRARVVGRTSDGALVVALPSGETAIVETPRRRMRPIPIERRERFAPPFQPFDPTFPPVD
jgi:hypothetical protein